MKELNKNWSIRLMLRVGTGYLNIIQSQILGSKAVFFYIFVFGLGGLYRSRSCLID